MSNHNGGPQRASEMPKTPYLRKKKDTYFVRVRVPSDLLDSIGKKEIVRTTGKQTRSEASSVSKSILADIETEFNLARMKRDHAPLHRIPDDEMIRLARRLFNEELEARERVRTEDSQLDRNGFVEGLNILAGDWGDAINADEKGDDIWSQHQDKTISDILKHNGYDLSSVSEGYKEARRILGRMIFGAITTSMHRAKGELGFMWKSPSLPLLSDTQEITGSQNSKQPSDFTIADLVDAYEKVPKRQALSQKTKDGYTIIFRVLKELIGETHSVSTINRDDCRRVRDTLLDLPPNYSKRRELIGLSVTEAAKRARQLDLPCLTNRTVRSYIQNLSALFRWAVREEYMIKNPAEGLGETLGKSRKKSRKQPFDSEQLTKIFNTGCVDDKNGYDKPGPNIIRRGRFWVPLLSLFTGMRLNECCQLHVNDICIQDNTPCILIKENDDQDIDDTDRKRVKTEAGIRFVPVHPELIKIGFLEYTERLKESKSVRLFPELMPGKNGYFSDPFSKWFKRFLKKAGADKQNTSFHSFRHTYRDATREAYLPQVVVQALGGWSSDNIEDVYGSGLRPQSLAKQIENISYPELDLSHLYL